MLRTNRRKPAASIKQDSDATDQAALPSADVASIAGYIAEMSAELAGLAGRSQLPMLAYFLNLARVEAESRARTLGDDVARREAQDCRGAG